MLNAMIIAALAASPAAPVPYADCLLGSIQPGLSDPPCNWCSRRAPRSTPTASLPRWNWSAITAPSGRPGSTQSAPQWSVLRMLPPR